MGADDDLQTARFFLGIDSSLQNYKYSYESAVRSVAQAWKALKNSKPLRAKLGGRDQFVRLALSAGDEAAERHQVRVYELTNDAESQKHFERLALSMDYGKSRLKFNLENLGHYLKAEFLILGAVVSEIYKSLNLTPQRSILFAATFAIMFFGLPFVIGLLPIFSGTALLTSAWLPFSLSLFTAWFSVSRFDHFIDSHFYVSALFSPALLNKRLRAIIDK